MTVSDNMNKILIIFAHPAFHKSRIHKGLADAARSVDGVTFHNLYDCYPDFYIRISEEQQLLLGHDILIWQHPFYWYSCPSLMKEWIDLVLEHNFAYGRKGTSLHDKKALSVISTGGSEAVYTRKEDHHYTIRQFLAPFHQMARLCGMDYLPPFAVFGSHLLTDEEISRHSRDYHRLLTALRDDTFPALHLRDSETINPYIPPGN